MEGPPDAGQTDGGNRKAVGHHPDIACTGVKNRDPRARQCATGVSESIFMCTEVATNDPLCTGSRLVYPLESCTNPLTRHICSRFFW